MYIKIFSRFILLVVFFTCSFLNPSTAQRSNTYYYMYGIPQSNQLNPAFQSDCKVHLGLPLISPLRVNWSSSSLRYDDIFRYDAERDEIITFMHPMGDRDAFLDALDPVNTIRAEFGSDIVSFGRRRDNWYFSFDVTERLEQNMNFTSDLAEFLIYGSKNQTRFNFSGTGVDFYYYRGVAFGLSYNFDDEFQLGGRARLLFGIANIKTGSNDINLKTSMEEWDIDTRMTVDVNIPLMDIYIDEDGKPDLDSIQLKSSWEEDYPYVILDNMQRILGIGNPGIAVDFGFNYHPVEFLSISASVVDLGFIRWRNDVYNFQIDGSYSFEGIEFSYQELKEKKDLFKPVLDSLESSYSITATKKAYTTALTGKFFMGAAYELNEKVRFGIVNRIRIYNYKFYNHITLSANVQPISMLSASLSYSIIGKNYANIGLGLSLRAGPLNLYFITDQAPGVFLFPNNIQSLNLRLGMNLVFGCAKTPKALKDRPLID